MNRKKILGRIVQILVFCILLSSILWWLNSILVIKRPDGITTMQNLYAQEPNTCDILFLGSSHAGMNLDAEVFWSEYGYSTYALWGSAQPFWNSYFFLLEALETQSPRLVVLDTYAAALSFEYSDSARQQTNVVGMRMGINKLNAIMVSAPSDNRINLLLQFPLFHSRISDLSLDDFMHFPWSENLINDKGTSYRYGSNHLELESYIPHDNIEIIHPKQELYLRKIIELCSARNIDLLLIKTPYGSNRMTHQGYDNYVQSIANAYNVPFINMNLLDSEIGLCSDDIWFDGSHLNTNGARKISSWLGSYISSHYDIPNHTDDPQYASWNFFAEQIREHYLHEISTTSDYCAELSRSNFPVLMIANIDSEDPDILQTMQTIVQDIGADPTYLPSTNLYQSTLFMQPVGVSDNNSAIYSPVHSIDNTYYFDNVKISIDLSEKMTIYMNETSIVECDDQGIFLFTFNHDGNICIDFVALDLDNNHLTHYNIW